MKVSDIMYLYEIHDKVQGEIESHKSAQEFKENADNYWADIRDYVEKVNDILDYLINLNVN